MDELSQCPDEGVFDIKNHINELYQCIAVKLLKKINTIFDRQQLNELMWQEKMKNIDGEQHQKIKVVQEEFEDKLD